MSRTDSEVHAKKRDPYLAILAYHALPLENGHSRSKFLMNRLLRMTVPSLSQILSLEMPDSTKLPEKKWQSRETSRLNFDKHYGTNELPVLNPGWIGNTILFFLCFG